MRFLIVTPLLPPEPGGPSYYSVGLEAALKKAGHETDLIAFREVRGLPSGVRHFVFLYKVLLRALKADVLIVLDTVSVAIPAVLAGWVLGKTIIVRTGGDFVWEQYVERTGEKVKLSEFYHAQRELTRNERILLWLQKHVVVRLATMFVFSTSWQLEIWLQPYGLHVERAAIIDNAYTPVLPEQELSHKPEERTRFVWVGRDIALKNVDTLESVFAKLREQYPQMELLLLRGVPREEVLAALTGARCLVVPSLSEVSPNIVLEARALGVPVVCTEDTGIRDTAKAGVVYVDTTDTTAFLQALEHVCDAAAYATLCDDVRSDTATYSRTYDDVAADFVALCDTL